MTLMAVPVKVRPALSPLVALGIGGPGVLPPPLDAATVRFYVKGRNALWHAVRALNLKVDDEVLVPAYHCGAELDAVLRAGAVVRFYAVDRNARTSVDDLALAITGRTRAIVITHFFGFPDPCFDRIIEWCRARRLTVIEDCAHALFSRQGARWLGSSGALAVFSIPKGVPAPDGGAILVNDPALHLETVNDVPLRNGNQYFVRRRVEEYLMNGPLATAHRALRKLGVDIPQWVARRAAGPCAPTVQAELSPADPNPHITFDQRTANWAISAVSESVLRHTDPHDVIHRRRRNYLFLLSALSDLPRIRLLREELPEGVCPLWFPIVLDDAQALHDHLRDAGIRSNILWNEFHHAFPTAAFPDATWLRTHVLALPIHQSVPPNALRTVPRIVREWAKRS